jgi:hypothetical protein
MSSFVEEPLPKGSGSFYSWANRATEQADTRRGVVRRKGRPAPTRRTWVRLLPPLLGEAMPFLPKSADKPLHIDN